MRSSRAPDLPAARRLRRATAIVLLAACAAGPVANAVEKHEVTDPHYGAVLFDFYQQKYFSALTQLMADQHFGRFLSQTEDAELLRGGMLLSYGMHVEAGRIFERLIDKSQDPAVRDRAWFYLGKIRYQRGYFAEAEQALARITGHLPGDLDTERQILHATLLMQRGRFSEAADELKTVRGGTAWGRYARYNLGVALVRAGDVDRGIALLDKLGKEAVDTEELASLRDKANVALGYTLLRSGQEGYARTCLERVRLNSIAANKALLAMGWAHIAQGHPDRALTHWLELERRPAQDAATQEALLAVPYAYGQLGAWRQSLQHYELANTAYEQELGQIDHSIAAIRAGKLTEILLRNQPNEEMGWFWKLDQLPDAPETRYLVQLMAGHDFQEALKNFRDLQFLIARLDHAVSDIGIFNDILDTRRRAFREKLPVTLALARERDAESYSRIRDELASVIERVERDGDAEALANDKEREQLRRLAAMRKTIERGAATDPDAAERVRVLQGLMTWDLSQSYPDRLWQVKKSLAELDRMLDDARSWREAIARSRDTVPREFDAFEARIRDLEPRIRALQQRARDLARAQSEYLGSLAVSELTAQRERIVTYLTQVRFAVAQIYDQSSDAKGVSSPGSHDEATP